MEDPEYSPLEVAEERRVAAMNRHFKATNELKWAQERVAEAKGNGAAEELISALTQDVLAWVEEVAAAAQDLKEAWANEAAAAAAVAAVIAARPDYYSS